MEVMQSRAQAERGVGSNQEPRGIAESTVR